MDLYVTLPAELVVLPAALVAAAIVAYRARLEDTRTIVFRLLLVAYGGFLVATTLFPFRIIVGPHADPIDFDAVQVIPLITADAVGIVLNVILFLPLGALLPEVTRATTWRRVALAGFLTSLGIELVQLVQSVLLSGSRAFDVDDLIANTAGVLLGYGAYRVFTSRWFGVARPPERSSRRRRADAARAADGRQDQVVRSSSVHAEP